MLVIEHNLDVIKTADWVIDMGPAGGNRGGTVVATGTPEEVAAHKESFTGEFLKPLLSPDLARSGPAGTEVVRPMDSSEVSGSAPVALADNQRPRSREDPCPRT